MHRKLLLCWKAYLPRSSWPTQPTTPIICARPSLPKARLPSSPTTRHGRSNIRSTSISMPSAISWSAASQNSSNSAASQPASKKPPEIISPSSLSQPSSYGCDKCPHRLGRPWPVTLPETTLARVRWSTLTYVEKVRPQFLSLRQLPQGPVFSGLTCWQLSPGAIAISNLSSGLPIGRTALFFSERPVSLRTSGLHLFGTILKIRSFRVTCEPLRKEVLPFP